MRAEGLGQKNPNKFRRGYFGVFFFFFFSSFFRSSIGLKYAGTLRLLFVFNNVPTFYR